jgi:CyaY protein
MTDQEYTTLVTNEMKRIYDYVSETYGEDIDLELGDGILKITLVDDSKLIVSRQAPVKQLWLAARHGGFHFNYVNDQWVDSKSGEEILTMMSRFIDTSLEE